MTKDEALQLHNLVDRYKNAGWHLTVLTDKRVVTGGDVLNVVAAQNDYVRINREIVEWIDAHTELN